MCTRACFLLCIFSHDPNCRLYPSILLISGRLRFSEVLFSWTQCHLSAELCVQALHYQWPNLQLLDRRSHGGAVIRDGAAGGMGRGRCQAEDEQNGSDLFHILQHAWVCSQSKPWLDATARNRQIVTACSFQSVIIIRQAGSLSLPMRFWRPIF